MAAPTANRHPIWAKRLVWVLAPLPGLWMLWLLLTGGLGANPVEALSRLSGDWTLRLLLATLAVTPLRRLTGWSTLTALRRPLGLWAFGYASLHALVYLVLDQTLDAAAIQDDLIHRPYLALGLSAFLLLVPLAATSTRRLMSRLGSRWRQIHRLIYPAAILGVLHYLWQDKVDLVEPLAYAFLLGLLLALRLPWLGWFPRPQRRPRKELSPFLGRAPHNASPHGPD